MVIKRFIMRCGSEVVYLTSFSLVSIGFILSSYKHWDFVNIDRCAEIAVTVKLTHTFKNILFGLCYEVIESAGSRHITVLFLSRYDALNTVSYVIYQHISLKILSGSVGLNFHHLHKPVLLG